MVNYMKYRVGELDIQEAGWLAGYWSKLQYDSKFPRKLPNY